MVSNPTIISKISTTKISSLIKKNPVIKQKIKKIKANLNEAVMEDKEQESRDSLRLGRIELSNYCPDDLLSFWARVSVVIVLERSGFCTIIILDLSNSAGESRQQRNRENWG